MRATLILVAVLVLALAGCGGKKVVSTPERGRPVGVSESANQGGAVIVQPGDSVSKIAARYGVDWRALASVNGLSEPWTIRPGERLILPGPNVRPAPQRSIAARSPAPSQRPATSAPPAKVPTGVVRQAAVANAPKFAWPTAGNVISTFVAGDRVRQGIDIAGSEGQVVTAAAAGEVVYSGTGLVGFGELIIVRHDATWLSAYGHNRKRLVQEGARVTAGQQIAELGASGAARPMLHFEIRRDGKPVDPLRVLPAR